MSNAMNAREAAFAQRIDRAGKTWIYQPRSFRTSVGSYQPDFYVIEDQAFYEIVGSRQAYSYARVKIGAFINEYPQHTLIVVNEGAWVKGRLKPRKPRPKRSTGSKLTKAWTNAERDLPPDSAAIIATAKELGLYSYASLAGLLGAPSSHVRNAIATDQYPAWKDAVRRALEEYKSAGIVSPWSERVLISPHPARPESRARSGAG